MSQNATFNNVAQAMKLIRQIHAAGEKALEWLTQIDIRPARRPQAHPSPLSYRHHQSHDQAHATAI
jgi:hypothetical protein